MNVTRTSLPASDLAVDHALAAISASMRFLLDVTPANLLEARQRFLDDGQTPEFDYRPTDDLDVVRAELDAVAVDEVEDPELVQMLRSKQRELELQLEMLGCRGTERFRELSTQLYGTVSPALHGDAEALLDLVAPPRPSQGDRLDAPSFARLAESELDHYRAILPDLEARVEISSESSGVMVSNGNVLIAPTVRVPRENTHALLQHEIGTHVLTHVNGGRQPLRLLGTGLADYDETQEGLAVFAEYLVGGLTGRRLRQLAARVIAVHQMLAGVGFAEVHAHLVDNGVRRVEAFTITMRVFRSGGLTKDAVYLRGLAAIVGHVGAGGSLDMLWLGKLPLSDLARIESLHQRGVLTDPLLVPRYLDAPDTQERLARIDATTSIIQLIGDST